MTSFSSINGSRVFSGGPETLIRRHTESDPWSYLKLDALQRQIARRVREGGRGALLISELAPVITLGRRASPKDVLMPSEELQRCGVELYSTDRGGLASYHGPGQWVVFAIDRLDRLTGDPRGVRKAVEGLLEVGLKVAKIYDSRVQIKEGAETGVWTSQGKVASVGVYVEDRVLLHGLSLNGFQTPLSFVGIRPCGLDAPVDFLLQAHPGDKPDSVETAFDELGNRILKTALERFWGSC